MPRKVIEAAGLGISIGGRWIVRGVGFTLHDGEVLAVIGPNGSGKTTLIKALLGVIPHDEGSVRLFGKERLRGQEAGRRVAYLPQSMQIDRTFPITLGEMLALWGKGVEACRYIDILELRGLLGRRVGDLSGGQLQRALLAYAICKEPGLLIMDEPTSWVDARGSDCILCLLEEFRKKGIAMVMVSHDYSVIRESATHVLGLGPEGAFFGPRDEPGMLGRIDALFGTSHHWGDKGLHFCTLKGKGRGGDA